MALKESKIAQTDYTRGGKKISDTAIPHYVDNLNQLDAYMKNIQNRLDPYMDYVNLSQAATQNDFLREYQKAMSKMTGNNYASTNGGYSSLNQQNYDDLQGYYDDLQSRYYAQGVNLATNLANQEWNMLAQTPTVWHNAYNAGKAYSDTERYNAMVDDYNSNAWTNIVSTLGDVGLASGNPWGMAAGAALKGVGTAFGKDFSAMDGLRQAAAGVRDNNQYSSGQSSTLGNLGGNLAGYLQNFDWYNKNPFTKAGGSK